MTASPLAAPIPPMVSRACNLLLGSPVRTAERLVTGSRTAVYRVALPVGSNVIVKLYSHTARRNALTEATAIRAVSAAVPVPRVLGYGTTSSAGATALVTSDLGPGTLGSAVRSGSVPRLQALRDLGTLLGRMHGAPVSTTAPRRPVIETVASLSRRCPSDVLDRLARALAIVTDPLDEASLVWCHGDPHLDNVVLFGTRQSRHLVDFTDSAPGRREADLAHALVMTDAHSQWDRHALLGAYPHALNDTHLAAWSAFLTVSCWTHARPGNHRTIWSNRLAELSRRTPHLFRPHQGRSHAPHARRRVR
ncbi:aminoglycoside phosphotransferase family protein [Streptomyces sp. NBC_01433]|uniref:phosphotransferase family protein n=1 Tax=Streptomyces sp. NBC_01433 TaxID=2903864 RepID=UPI002259B93E|nr:aminoglycoside phosphotransferase family protein [Streptomyces sp. NBC_01433]MCX4680761.1 aminoglycoside phosphotransferase family protein [Streptomyces sp. NBC_01433]